ncbi:MAG: hypothetical protein Q4G09_00385 [Clostridia bacterium]|nr:hypothetical protein [Clostridia bacterium]
MSNKKTLYKAYLEKKKENKVRHKILKKYNISDNENTIIINKKSINLFLLLFDFITKIIKVIFYIIITVLITIGATVLLNEELRNKIIIIFTSAF